MRGNLALLLSLLAGPAFAFSDGAPWETTPEQGCSQCHFDRPPHAQSRALVLDGLPERLEPGARYALTLRIDAEAAAAAGFLLFALGAAGPVGSFTGAEPPSETRGAVVRSTAGPPPWRFEWQAPTPLDGEVRFLIWANTANGDDSPFGDSVHVRSWTLLPRR